MTGDEMTRAGRQAQRERLPPAFALCARAWSRQIRGVRLPPKPLLTLALVLLAPLCRANDLLDRFGVVLIKPSSTSIYIGTVSMTMPPFVRRDSVYSSTYFARVFPYFFYNESGRISIVIPDRDLKTIEEGGAIDFKGSALSDAGEKRRVEGRATPTGPSGGRIRVRVFVTRRIALTYETTYELRGPVAKAPAVTPR